MDSTADALAQLAQLANKCLPRLDADETLYSWCGHAHRWSGNLTGVRTNQQLFGSPRAGFYHDFPAHLDTFIKSTNGGLGDANELALRHTLLGFYLPFQSESRAKEILTAVGKGAIPRLKFHLALPKSGVGADHPLKGCDACMKQDIEDLGNAIWRVEHQLPSVWVCRRHQRALWTALDDYTPIHRRDWILPACVPEARRARYRVADRAADHLFGLADISAAVATCMPSSLEPQQLAAAYRAALSDKDLMLTGSEARGHEFISWLRHRYAPLADLPGMGFLKASAQSHDRSLLSAIAPAPERMHPFKHVLLIHGLFGDWRAFEAACQRVAKEPSESDLFGQVNALDVSKADPRLARFALQVKKGLSISAAAQRLRVSRTTGVRWAKVLKLRFTLRTKSLTSDHLDRVRDQLRQGRTKREIVAATGISSVSLDRLISSEPDTRRQWLEARHAEDRDRHRDTFLHLMQQNPGVPVHTLRKIPGNGFHWLYRHDRTWLVEHLPAIWQERDEVESAASSSSSQQTRRDD